MNNQALQYFSRSDNQRIIRYPLTFETKDRSILDKYVEGERIIQVDINSGNYRAYVALNSMVEELISAIPISNQYHSLNVRIVEGELLEDKVEYKLDPRVRMRLLSSVNLNSEPRTTILQTDVLLNLFKNIANQQGLDVDLFFNTISKFFAIDGDTVYVLIPVLPEN